MTVFDILYHDRETEYFWCLVTVANVAISNVNVEKMSLTVFTASVAVE